MVIYEYFNAWWKALDAGNNGMEAQTQNLLHNPRLNFIFLSLQRKLSRVLIQTKLSRDFITQINTSQEKMTEMLVKMCL